jgi:ATP phosphoribosyltransferase
VKLSGVISKQSFKIINKIKKTVQKPTKKRALMISIQNNGVSVASAAAAAIPGAYK